MKLRRRLIRTVAGYDRALKNSRASTGCVIQLPGPAVVRLAAVLEAAGAPQKLYPGTKPRIVESASVSFVEVERPCSIGS
jgi:hypothetical protein